MAEKRSLVGRRVMWRANQNYRGVVLERVDRERSDGTVKTLYCVRWRGLGYNSWLEDDVLVVIP